MWEVIGWASGRNSVGSANGGYSAYPTQRCFGSRVCLDILGLLLMDLFSQTSSGVMCLVVLATSASTLVCA